MPSIMNWTGGRLHRHSHNKRGMLQKTQKQHFAKAKMKRQHAHPGTPQCISDETRADGNGVGAGVGDNSGGGRRGKRRQGLPQKNQIV